MSPTGSNRPPVDGHWLPLDADPGPPVAGVTEEELLTGIFARLPQLTDQPGVLIGPGDDAAVLKVSGALVTSTDAMVHTRDWRRAWSTPQDVGAKLVVQNLADIAAMGARPTGLLLSLVAPSDLPLAWVWRFTEGAADAARSAGVPVLGGDLSSAAERERGSAAGDLMVSATSFGEQTTGAAVTRSGAEPGSDVAVSGGLGRSGAGWWLLESAGRTPAEVTVAQEGWSAHQRALVDYHRRPDPDLGQGVVAARSGAQALIDLSDGLVRDLGRIARASGVRLDLDRDVLAGFAELLQPAVPPAVAWDSVTGGGEEHVLAGVFRPGTTPSGWTVIGRAREIDAPGLARVELDGVAAPEGGWDHFG